MDLLFSLFPAVKMNKGFAYI